MALTISSREIENRDSTLACATRAEAPPPTTEVDSMQASRGYREIRMLIDGHRYDEAAAGLQKLLESDPASPVCHNDLGALYYHKGDKLRALYHYEKAVRFEPANITFQKNLADFYYFELGCIDDAIEIYLSVLRQNPDNIETLVNLGRISTAVNRLEEARIFYGKALELDPLNSAARMGLEGLPLCRGANDQLPIMCDL